MRLISQTSKVLMKHDHNLLFLLVTCSDRRRNLVLPKHLTIIMALVLRVQSIIPDPLRQLQRIHPIQSIRKLVRNCQVEIICK